MRNIALKMGSIGGTALVLALVACAAAAGGFYGQSTRESDAAVATLVSSEVGQAKASANAAKDVALAQADAKHRTDRRALVKKQARTLKREKAKAFEEGQAAGYDSGYSSGNSAGYSSGSEDGYSSGSEEGFSDGLASGSDELTCSDDADVSWLPYCDY